MGVSAFPVATTPNQSYQTSWARQTTNYPPIQAGTTATTNSVDRTKFIADLGTVEADAIVAIEIDDNSNPDRNCLICYFPLTLADLNTGTCMTCDTPLITPEMGHKDILAFLDYYCDQRNLDPTVPYYVYCMDENNNSNNFLINIKSAGQISNLEDPEVELYSGADFLEYTVCCSTPLTMIELCKCTVTVLEEHVADFDKAHKEVDIYDSTDDCLTCDSYYQTTCPQFKNALINYTTYNSIVNVQIKKCDSYVYYKDLTAVNNFESTYYD